LQVEEPEILASGVDEAPVEDLAVPTIQGGRERGIILHKLIEEVLTGETAESDAELVARAIVLIRAMDCLVANDPAQGLVPSELAACVIRAFALPEIAALRPGLVPELPVYASALTDEVEQATAGIVDAISFGADGMPEVVIDWKTDVAPTPETLEHYRLQVGAYLYVAKAERGLIILVTSGMVMPVARGNPSRHCVGSELICRQQDDAA
jgi:exodeoxyribonuclease-5